MAVHPHRNESANTLLTINAGSSSIKFALFGADLHQQRILDGAIDGIGTAHSQFHVQAGPGAPTFSRRFPIPERVTAVQVLCEWLAEQLPPASLAAIGHRVVYGGSDYQTTQAVSGPLLELLFSATTFDSEHLPQAIDLIEALRRAFPDALHIACFDSAFHADMPRVASMLPIPRRFHGQGIKRLGFHGISCACLMQELARSAGPAAAAGKVLLAHLGGGASVTAVAAGKSVDTSMGLTPAGGMVMGCRSGDVDPGLAWRLARDHHMTPAQFNHMVNHESGLLGVSGLSADLNELLKQEPLHPGAADAVALFCYQARKQIGAMAAAMGGLDTLVFAGGVGEHLAPVRARICAGLAFLGIELDEESNCAHAPLISAPRSRVSVRIIHTDEQAMIAAEMRALLAQQQRGAV